MTSLRRLLSTVPDDLVEDAQQEVQLARLEGRSPVYAVLEFLRSQRKKAVPLRGDTEAFVDWDVIDSLIDAGEPVPSWMGWAKQR